MAGGKTSALRVLEKAGVAFTLHEYLVRDHRAVTYGEAVARALRVDPERVFKTLIAEVDGEPVVAIVPVAGSLSVRSLVRAAAGRAGRLADEAVAERLTGYRIGGISPFGQRTRLPAYVDEWVEAHETVLVSGGRIGLQVEVAPEDLIRLTGATVAAIAV